jgi:hypothetical protein
MTKAETAVLTLLLVAFLCKPAAMALAAAKKAPDFKTGKLLDVGTEDRLVDGTTYRFALFMVQIEDIVYTARGDRLGRVRDSVLTMRSGDPGQDLIVGDPIQAAVDGDTLILVKPKDGKQIKTTITT